jgi:anaerobic sulfite reductase subunit C
VFQAVSQEPRGAGRPDRSETGVAQSDAPKAAASGPPPCVVRVCRGSEGCPRAVVDVAAAAAALTATLDGVGVAGVVRRKAGAGSMLEHHRFKVTLSGCPNACSQPQIADVGLVGQERPLLDEAKCVSCGLCVDACAEAVFSLADGHLSMDESRCVGCGACMRVCPTVALTPAATGWRVLVGGRLGRHPRLGAEVMSCADLDGASAVATKVIELWELEGCGDERVGVFLDRLAYQEDATDGEESRSIALTRLLFQGEVES